MGRKKKRKNQTESDQEDQPSRLLLVDDAAGRLIPMENRLYQDTAEAQPNNTKFAYDPKIKEFTLFCDAFYAESTFPHQVTPEKVFKFLFYQSYRNVRKRGGKRVASTSFNVDDYKKVIDTFTASLDAQPSDPPGYSVVNQYMCAILQLHDQQRLQMTNQFTIKEIKTSRVVKLLKYVRERRVTIARSTYKEKVDYELLPYINAQRFPDLELYFWERHNPKGQHTTHSHMALASLRNRDCLLTSKCGILRGESLFMCELSDLLHVTLKTNKNYPTPMFICIQQLTKGKCNKLKDNHKLFGRHTRHKDARLCAVDARGFYLMYRLYVTSEQLHFQSNELWFDVKLLVDSTGRNNTQAIDDETYAKAIRDACSSLKLDSKKFVHFGRSIGCVDLELNEVDGEDIKRLGNWNPDIQDTVYSSKLPLLAMKVAAGFDKDEPYWVPRAMYDPPDELQKEIFPFVERELEAVQGKALPTATYFLLFLKSLRSCILQDAAVLMKLGRKHPLFQLPVFHSVAFDNFSRNLHKFIEDLEDPTTKNIDSILPGITGRFSNLNADSKKTLEAIENLKDQGKNIEHNVLKVLDCIKTGCNAITASMEVSSTTPEIRDHGHDDGVLIVTGNEIVNTEVPTATANVSLPVIPLRFVSVTHMKHFWDHVLKPYETLHKGWRRSFTTADAKRFSRLKIILGAIDHRMNRLNQQSGQVLTDLDVMFTLKNSSMVRLVESLKADGDVITKRSMT